MIIKIGDIFESKAKTLVNTVNCVGVMGKGIALEFKKRYPDMFSEYVALCNSGEVKPGIPYCYQNLCGVSVINFPTKNHWRSPSKLSYIISGLDWFSDNYKALNITSVAFPPLGCGNGGLPWSVVGPLMYSKLKDLPIDIEIYAPYGTSSEQLTEKYLADNSASSQKEIIGNQIQHINKYWYLILYVIRKLNHDKYSLNVGRTIFQKICYLLTYVGLPMGFRFAEGQFGPYSNEAKQALAALSNANLMSEKKLGRMVETVVSDNFKFDSSVYTKEEIAKADKAFDLLSRIRSTEQAEIIATVLFSYDELSEKNTSVTEEQIFKHTMSWKPHWKPEKENAVKTSISSLSVLGWISPQGALNSSEYDDWMY